jgi:acid stress chaperone HdeB
MRKIWLLAGLLVSVMAISPAGAQVTIDVSKITCDQWRGYKVVDPDYVAIWLSGYFNSKRNNTVIGVQEFKENIGRLKDLCIRNPNTPVMQIVEDQIGAKK